MIASLPCARIAWPLAAALGPDAIPGVAAVTAGTCWSLAAYSPACPGPGGAALDVGLPFDFHIDSGKETVTNMFVSQKRWGGRIVLNCNIIRPEMVLRVC